MSRKYCYAKIRKTLFCFVVFITISLPFYLSGIMSDHQFGNQFMCSVVASHVSHLPTTNLSFVWIAPPASWVAFPVIVLFSLSPRPLYLVHVSAETSSEGFLLHISSASRSQRIIGSEWEGNRSLILIIVLRESIFHISYILDENSFGQTAWKITFCRLAPAAAFIR